MIDLTRDKIKQTFNVTSWLWHFPAALFSGQWSKIYPRSGRYDNVMGPAVTTGPRQVHEYATYEKRKPKPIFFFRHKITRLSINPCWCMSRFIMHFTESFTTWTQSQTASVTSQESLWLLLPPCENHLISNGDKLADRLIIGQLEGLNLILFCHCVLCTLGQCAFGFLEPC